MRQNPDGKSEAKSRSSMCTRSQSEPCRAVGLQGSSRPSATSPSLAVSTSRRSSLCLCSCPAGRLTGPVLLGSRYCANRQCLFLSFWLTSLCNRHQVQPTDRGVCSPQPLVSQRVGRSWAHTGSPASLELTQFPPLLWLINTRLPYVK